ncbi:hypothetical protein [Sorangium sp. So ce861]|uniref:hypothetical protein n=1 Tax=Sorangium sp. So ce861 TaxID=3133323 RepID=UPI003F62D97F
MSTERPGCRRVFRRRRPERGAFRWKPGEPAAGACSRAGADRARLSRVRVAPPPAVELRRLHERRAAGPAVAGGRWRCPVEDQGLPAPSPGVERALLRWPP